LEKPNNTILDEIITTIDELLDLKDRVARLEIKAKEETRRICLIENDNERADVARYLYWLVPYSRVEEIAIGYQGRRKNKAFDQMIGSAPAGFKCSECSCLLEVNNRTLAATLIAECREHNSKPPHGHQRICPRCKKISDEKKAISREEIDRRNRLRIKELKALPYEAYIQTPEWKNIRARLEITLAWERHGFGLELDEYPRLACYVCQKTHEVEPIHRVGADRGQETNDDVVFVCSPCENKLYREGLVVHSER